MTNRRMRATRRVLYVVALLAIIIWQGLTIQTLKAELSQRTVQVEQWKAEYKANQETIKGLLISLGALSF